MWIATGKLPIDTAWSATDGPEGATVFRVRFGDDVLLYAPDADLRPDVEHPGLNGRGFRTYPGVRPGHLHLVVQLGDLFSRHNPGVPVILDKGRYLVVDLDPEQARELAAREDHCYRIRPIEGDLTVFEARPPLAGRSAPVQWIRRLADRVSRDGVRRSLERLVSYPNRLSTSSHFAEAAAWARDELQGMGYSVYLVEVPVGSGTSLNVVAHREGGGIGTRRLVLVTAHLDSINADSQEGAAPGADDNASGCAGLLEIARIFRDHPAVHDLGFVLFGGEEQGLYGSRSFVAKLPDEVQTRIRGVVNMDMIATVNVSPRSVLIEGAPVSRSLIDDLANAAATYTELGVQTSLDAALSDHVPFIEAGLPAVLTIEGADQTNPNVHSARDTLDHVDPDLMQQILRMNVAAVAGMLGTTEKTEEAPMNTRLSPAEELLAAIRSGGGLAAALRTLPFQFSGCYQYGGGASAREGRGFVDLSSGQSTAALHNPIYRLEEPVYLASDEDDGLLHRVNEQLRFTLHIDIDGTDPLGVVSGTVASGPASPDEAHPHFIGRVIADDPFAGGRRIRVQDFRFRWPDSGEVINQLTIELNGSPLVKPTAQVTFHGLQPDRVLGPFTAEQDSVWFREVEMEVDREVNAVDVEPYDTHSHPDRPSDLPREELTLENSFARAGIRITRPHDSGALVDTSAAGADQRWNYSELHDSMRLHWQHYANKPQWKMWVFLAQRADDDSLGGVMFDGEIDEPGGVDRQGTAIFTRCPYFHTLGGEYIQANPPGEEAVKRELFFNLIHEIGHSFNLAHSFQKHLEGGWSPPPWMPLVTNTQALSWMNYPDQATPGGGAVPNASWFYKRFRFRFDDSELLFLRHAPETYVEMGAAAWFENHGRVSRISVDPRLALTIGARKTMYELGEPILLELCLKNVGRHPVLVHRNLDPSDGLVEVAVTNPRGERRPFLPVDHTRTLLQLHTLQPNEQPIRCLLDLTMGSFGFPFKEPGAYRIEASYRNVDGTTAAAVVQLYVRPPQRFDVFPIVNELFDARVGFALYIDGTRVMEDVNERLDWVRKRLDEEAGPENPISTHLTVVRFKPLATASKVIDPRSDKVIVFPEEPGRVVEELHGVIFDRPEAAADTMGDIWYREVVDAYTGCAERERKHGKASEAQELMLRLFRRRGVDPSLVKRGLERQPGDLASR